MSIIDRKENLKKYEELLQKIKSVYNVSEVQEDIWSVSPRGKINENKVALVALTHGDEVIGLHIFIELLINLLEGRISLFGELFLILANREAYIKDQRYIESDLNRSYGKNNGDSLESRRVQIIKSVIDKSDYIIDIHQSIEPTLTPFFILPFSNDAYDWVSSVSPNLPIVARREIKEATTLSTYCFLINKKSVAFEVGGYGVDLYQLEFGLNTIKSFLQFAWNKNLPIKLSNFRVLGSVYDMSFCHSYSEGVVKFERNFKNFEEIQKGQTIVYVDSKPVYSPMSGKILLYPQKWFRSDSIVKPDGLFFVLQEFRV